MKKRFTEEQIVRILREARVEWHTDPGVVPQAQAKTFFRWRSKYGGTDVSDARRLKELESENTRLTSGRRAASGDRWSEGILRKKMTTPADVKYWNWSRVGAF